MYIAANNYQPLSGAATTLSTIFLGQVGALASVATCKGRCDWAFPFNREKRMECKAGCEENREERRDERLERRGDGSVNLPPTPLPIIPIAVGAVALIGAWFLLRKKAS